MGHGADQHAAITQIVEHPSLDAARRGIVDQLQNAGFVVNNNPTVDYQSAQGNPTTATQIARKFIGDRPEVGVAISTPSAQGVTAVNRDIPLVLPRLRRRGRIKQ